MRQVDLLADQARTETYCRGCGGAKSIGLIVCWPCFSYRDDAVPFREFHGTLSQWLEYIQLNPLIPVP